MMAYDVDTLLWQTSFAIAMFFGTFVSYLLPLYIFINRQNRQQRPENLTSDCNQQSYYWSNLIAFDSLDQQHQKYRWKHWLSYCNCISAGVFLGVCFLSLVPCVENEFESLIKDFSSLQHIFGSFSIGQFSVICGLFLVLFLENILSRCFNRSQHDDSPVLYLDEETIDQRSDEHEEELLLGTNELPTNNNSIINQSSHQHNVSSNVRIRSSSTNHHHNHGHHHLNVGEMHSRKNSMFSFFILMFATSVHSLFEGMALGLQTNLRTAIHLFIGIILHECLVALALGLNAIRLQQDAIQMSTHLKFAFVFSLNIPFGSFLGVLIGYTPGHIGRFISAIFQGFAAGTFIHITFFELIPEEFIIDNHHSNHNKNDNHQCNNNNNNIDNNQTRNRQSLNEQQSFNDIDLNDSDNNNHNHINLNESSSSLSKIKLRKISLLFVGFLLMALIAFCFSE